LETALRQSEEQFRILFETNPVAMYVFDRNTLYIIAVNKVAIHQYGFTEQEFLAKTVMEIRPEEDIPALLRDMSRNSVGLQPQRGIWKHRTRAGAIIEVEIVCNHIDFHGIDSVLVAAADGTERKRAQEMLQNSEKKYRVLFEESGGPLPAFLGCGHRDHPIAQLCLAPALHLARPSRSLDAARPIDAVSSLQRSGFIGWKPGAYAHPGSRCASAPARFQRHRDTVLFHYQLLSGRQLGLRAWIAAKRQTCQYPAAGPMRVHGRIS
jgi:PAS domain S-box-containing protein